MRLPKVLVVFDTRYGSTMALALKVAEGVKGIAGAEVVTRRPRISEPESIIRQNRRWHQAHEQFEAIREATLEDFEEADAIITGSPTRFGVMTAAMKELWDRTGVLWAEGRLFGKVGAVFSSTSTPHGGNETTLLSLMLPMLHHGMVIVSPGYGHPATYQASSPYGATWVSGPGADHDPDEATEKAAAFLGQRVAEVAVVLAGNRVVHEVR